MSSPVRVRSQRFFLLCPVRIFLSNVLLIHWSSADPLQPWSDPSTENLVSVTCEWFSFVVWFCPAWKIYTQGADPLVIFDIECKPSYIMFCPGNFNLGLLSRQSAVLLWLSQPLKENFCLPLHTIWRQDLRCYMIKQSISLLSKSRYTALACTQLLKQIQRTSECVQLMPILTQVFTWCPCKVTWCFTPSTTTVTARPVDIYIYCDTQMGFVHGYLASFCLRQHCICMCFFLVIIAL